MALDIINKWLKFFFMKTSILRLFVFAILAFSLDHALAANPAPPRVTVELRDGSHIVGESVDKKLHFHSPLLGELALPIQDIRSVDCLATNSIKLTTTVGDVLSVEFKYSDLVIKTSFGKVDLLVNSIVKIKVAGPVPGLNMPGLVALWSGNDGGKDIAGGHDASVSAGVTYIDAKTGPGFYFDGGANQISAPTSPDLNFGAGQDFSIEALVEVAPPPPEMRDDILTIVDKRETPDSIRCLGYILAIWHGQISFRMSDDINANGTYGMNGPDLFDGRFHQVAVTVARHSTDGGKLYVDGSPVATFDPTSQAGDLSNDQPLLIGKHSCAGYYAFFHGLIDHVAIYNRALSGDEIKSLCPMDNTGVQLPAGHTIQVHMPGIQPMYNGIYDYPDSQGRPTRIFRGIP